MEWIPEFYSTTGKWWGDAEAAVTDRDHVRVESIKAICGDPPKSVLELGSGYGTTASVTGAAGFDVTAIELSERITYSAQFEKGAAKKSPRYIRGDFYSVDAGGPFDIVTYWNGFGVGDDADQRRLLRRISNEWLVPGATALIEVGNPFVRASWNGETEHRDPKPELGYRFAVEERTEYDPVHNRFIDTWWEVGSSEAAVTQTLRNYTPADLRLLLEGTGLQLAAVHLADGILDIDATHAGNTALLHDEQEYLAVLVVT